MMYTRYSALVLIACFTLAQCRTAKPLAITPTARIGTEGFITCFEAGLAGGTLWCEASAVLAQGDRLYLAIDKDMPAPRSSVFYLPRQPGSSVDAPPQPVFLDQPVLRAAHKFEELARSPNQRWTFLTTAFDRIKPGSAELDGYNMLLAWHPGEEGNVQVVGADTAGGASLGLQRQLQQVLGNPAYFKIEGLAATNTHLWFGVREQGERYDKFEHRITILTVPYNTKRAPGGGERVVLGQPTLVRTFSVDAVDPALPKPLAVSSIEYDPARRCFWLLTSYEQGETIGAYLWVISETAMATNGDLRLIRTPDGKPLTFNHKAEDMTFTDANTLFVIHDDDRIRTYVGGRQRQPNEAAYSVVHIE